LEGEEKNNFRERHLQGKVIKVDLSPLPSLSRLDFFGRKMFEGNTVLYIGLGGSLYTGEERELVKRYSTGRSRKEGVTNVDGERGGEDVPNFVHPQAGSITFW